MQHVVFQNVACAFLRVTIASQKSASTAVSMGVALTANWRMIIADNTCDAQHVEIWICVQICRTRLYSKETTAFLSSFEVREKKDKGFLYESDGNHSSSSSSSSLSLHKAHSRMIQQGGRLPI